MDEARVRSEQIRTLYRQTPAVLVTSLVNAGILCALLWGSAAHAVLAGFACALAVVSAARHALYRRYFRSSAQADSALWARRFVVGSASSGVIWGVAGFLLYGHGDEAMLLILPLIVAG